MIVVAKVVERKVEEDLEAGLVGLLNELVEVGISPAGVVHLSSVGRQDASGR